MCSLCGWSPFDNPARRADALTRTLARKEAAEKSGLTLTAKHWAEYARNIEMHRPSTGPDNAPKEITS